MINIAEKATITYDEARELARHKNVKVRQALAARKDINPEILYFMANDASPEVRKKIADNDAAPRHAYLILAKDSNHDVRCTIAEKIAKIAPDLSATEQDKLQKITHEALEILTRDQATRVRQILAETLKDVANVPANVIKKLAMDTNAMVARPVLEFSPVLTDNDLIEIIEFGPAKGGLGAISRRSQVNEGVSEAIVATDDVEAIADLLGNTSAQIREETLDDLIERAPDVNLWHAPLVSRPKLPPGAATRMAHFLADNLLETLQQRGDLDEETLNAVKEVTLHRLNEVRCDKKQDIAVNKSNMDFSTFSVLIPMAMRLQRSDKLNGKIIAKAMHASDNDFVIAALTVRSNVAEKSVQKIFSSCSAKGIVALTWKAGLPMKMAYHVQQRIARIMPSEVIAPKDDGTFPLSDDEMTWQIEFFNDLAAKKDQS